LRLGLEVRPRMSIQVTTEGPAAMAAAPAPSPTLSDAWRPLDIASDRCKGCELCITACPHHVLALDERVVNHLGYHPVRLTDPAGCTSCVLCARVCPDVVFTIYAPRKVARE
jgi:2-oxoglutarate ferredoxin oxidoreductase subunit delta